MDIRCNRSVNLMDLPESWHMEQQPIWAEQWAFKMVEGPAKTTSVLAGRILQPSRILDCYETRSDKDAQIDSWSFRTSVTGLVTWWSVLEEYCKRINLSQGYQHWGSVYQVSIHWGMLMEIFLFRVQSIRFKTTQTVWRFPYSPCDCDGLSIYQRRWQAGWRQSYEPIQLPCLQVPQTNG